jgi:hypothetical protein
LPTRFLRNANAHLARLRPHCLGIDACLRTRGFVVTNEVHGVIVGRGADTCASGG